jgi:lysophospholipase L1-like esterase
LLAGAALVCAAGVAVLAWAGVRGDVVWSVRLLGFARAADMRVYGGLRAARLLHRTACVLLGDSRFEMLGSEGIEIGARWLVPAGFSGATARGWSIRLRERARDDGAPVVFVIWLGVNDVVNEHARGTDVVRYLRALTDYALRGPDDRVLLLEQFPLAFPASADSERVNRELRVVNDGLAAIAAADERVGLLPLWTAFSAEGGADACRECLSDPLHLNEGGNRFVRARISAALRQL